MEYSQILTPKITDADIADIRAMSKSQKDKLRKQINFAEPTKIFKCVEGKTDEIVCPICGNGTGNDATGVTATPTETGWLYHCFKCGEFSGDLIKIIATANQLSTSKGTKDFPKILAIGKKILSDAYAGKFENIQLKFKGVKVDKEYSKEVLELIAGDITDAMKNVELIPIEERRGLTLETLKKTNAVRAGYIAQWRHPLNRNDSNIPLTPRIIFATNNLHYLASLPMAERKHTDKKYWKMHAGTKAPYFIKAENLSRNNWKENFKHIIIVEGEIDAISIWQSTEYNETVAVLGGAAEKGIVDELNRIFPDRAERLNFQPIILFDNDNAGTAASPKLQRTLFNEGYPAYVAALVDTDKFKVDANDILTAGANNDEVKAFLAETFPSIDEVGGQAVLKSRIEQIISSAQIELSSLQERVRNFQAEQNSEKEKFGNDFSKPITDSDIAAAAEYIQNLIDSDENLTIKTVYTDEVYKAAAIVKISDIGLFEQFKEKIKDSGVRVGNFYDQVNIIVNKIQTAAFNEELKENAAQMDGIFKELFGDTRDISLPPDYEMSVNGIYKLEQGKFCTVKVPVAAAPFYISGFYCINQPMGEKRFYADITALKKKRIIKIRQVDEGFLFDAKKITALISAGLPINSSTAKNAVEYLTNFRARNQYEMEIKPLFEKLGWQNLTADDFVFVEPYSRKYDIAKSNTLASHLYTKGDCDKWLAIVKKVFDTSPVGRFIISAALSSLILKVIGCRVFVVYLRCKSRAGKSAVFKLAASIFGDTDILKSFNSTVNSLEGVIADISPFPAIFDERQVAGANFDTNNFVYRAGEGSGRGRCNTDGTLKNIKKWHNVTICNGEEKLTESAKTQGLHTRTLEIDFRGDKIISDELATELHIMFDTSDVFGHGAKIFLEKLQAETLDSLRDAYRLICNAFKNKFPAYIDDHRRYIAAVTVADVLIQKFFFGVDDDTAFNSALDNAIKIFDLIETQINLSDEEREKEFISGWLAENRLHFIGGTSEKEEKLVTPVFGEFKDNAAYVIGTTLKEVLRRAGMSYSKVRTDLLSAGVIEKVDGKDASQKKIGGVNCFVLKIVGCIGDTD